MAALVEGLKAVGLARGQIELVSVQAEIKSGLLGKSSAASYAVKVHCGNVEEVARSARRGHGGQERAARTARVALPRRAIRN